MAENVLVDYVRSALNEVINTNFKTTPKITINQETAPGAGNASKTCSINLNGEEKELNIFVKYMPKIDYTPDATSFYKNLYKNEIKFYGKIFPAMLQLQRKQKVKSPFINVPKFYPWNVENIEIPPVLLEDIKVLGYSLKDKNKPIDDKHMFLALKAFAKYHALSFALKDQNRKLFDDLANGLGDMMSYAFKWFQMDAIVTVCIEKMKDVINPDADKKIFDILPSLTETLVSFSSTAYEYVDEYAVIGQGDCNSNNLMFLYDEKTGDPIDVKLLDWQFLRLNSPVLDVSYFFYTVATKTMLDDLDRYLKYYHDELSYHLIELRSDPSLLYPFEVFTAHWKKYSKFALALSFSVAKLPLFQENELPNVVGNTDTAAIVEGFCRKIKLQHVYDQVITDLLRHFIDRDFL